MNNAALAKAFRTIRNFLQKEGEENKFRLMAYSRAAIQIELLDKELSTVLAEGEPALHEYCGKVPHIGEKSREKIMQLIRTGTCPELDKVAAAIPAEQDSFLTEEEMTPPKRKSSVNHRAEVTAVRRPREQAMDVVKRVLTVVDKYFTTSLVCGSWRRHLPTIKDVDVAITGIREEWATEGVDMLFSRIEKDLGITETNVVKRGKAQTAFYADSEFGEWHVDFWYIMPESWGAAILFATGSADFNIQMRGWLKARGFKLNRYGLYKVTEENPQGVLVAQQTEEEIFKALGLEFVPPPDRIAFNPGYKAKAS